MSQTVRLRAQLSTADEVALEYGHGISRKLGGLLP
jgi:hypothetical protein